MSAFSDPKSGLEDSSSHSYTRGEPERNCVVMVALLISGLLLMALALLLRERWLQVERKKLFELYSHTHEEMLEARGQTEQLAEELFVLRTALTDAGIVEESDLMRSHLRLMKQLNQPGTIGTPDEDFEDDGPSSIGYIPDKDNTIH